MIKPFPQIFVVGACLRRSPNVTDQIGILVFVIDKSVAGDLVGGRCDGRQEDQLVNLQSRHARPGLCAKLLSGEKTSL